MLFNSLDFIIFAIVFFALWPLARKGNNVRWGYITLASFVFYGWWDWRFLFLIVGSGAFNFFLGAQIASHRRWGKFLIWLVVAGNIGILGIFKYLDFTVHNFNWFLNLFGYGHSIPLPSLILPVGISFYTFQAMSYALDIYRGELRPARNFLHFLAYLSCFPQLVAGPIVRAADFMPQLERPGYATDEGRWEGLKLIIWGYFKKCVIADNLAPMVNAAFTQQSSYGDLVYWWVIMLAFALQIFGDFSGYSDIARGLARWMGYDFMVNFNHPYKSTDFQDFWRRWHISLSSWFRDYVYIPLGGSRCSKWHGRANLFLTMLISGFWHGASWNFVLWGGLHGLFLVVEKLLPLPKGWQKRYFYRLLGTIITFSGVIVAWVFFRAESFTQTLSILGSMLGGTFGQIPAPELFGKAELLLALCLAVIVYTWLEVETLRKLRIRLFQYIEVPVYTVLGLSALFLRGTGGAFIYFQF